MKSAQAVYCSKSIDQSTNFIIKLDNVDKVKQTTGGYKISKLFQKLCNKNSLHGFFEAL